MKNKRILLIICSFLLVNMFYVNTASATSKLPISGKITDSDLKPINGAKIVFEMEGGLNGIQVAKTNYRGNYTIYLPLTSKTYWVTIGKDKYRTYRGKIHLTGDSDNFNFTVHK